MTAAPVSTEAELESSALQGIAEDHGTPVYVLDLERLERCYSAFTAAWSGFAAPVDVFYSVKTNYLPIICQFMRRRGAGADVVSGYELEAALASGFPGDRIVFNGPMKTREEIERVVDVGGLVNIDALSDIDRLEACAQQHGRCIEVGLRVNPGISPYTNAGSRGSERAAMMARRSKFGWPTHTPAAARVAQRIAGSPHLRLVAIHCQLGSQITDTDAYLLAIERVAAFLADQSAANIRTLNIGGGFGVPGIHRHRGDPATAPPDIARTTVAPAHREAFDLEQLVRRLEEILTRHGLTDIAIACEPGRALVSDAMSLICRVVSVKDIGEGTWVVLDGGVNLLPTAGVAEEHQMAVLGREDEPLASFMVGGPLCYDQDVFSYSQSLAQDLEIGDLVEIRDAGAYSVTRATNFIRGRAPVVAVGDGRSELCWRRETRADIFSFNVPTCFDS